jgi:hypothetical protein
VSDYCGDTSFHTKKRGRIRPCNWCGQRIEIGERYGKWLWFDEIGRATLYAHEECLEVWWKAASEEGGYVESSGDEERPKKKGCGS